MKRRSLKSIVLTAMVIFLLIEVPLAEALVGAIRPIVNIAGALSNKKIRGLIELSNEKVGRTLGKLKLSDELLEDTYLRIAIGQGRISRKEAADLQKRYWKNQKIH